MEYKLLPLGDQAVIIEFGTEISTNIQKKIHLVTAYLDEQAPPWMIEYIPAFTTVTIFYQPAAISRLCNHRYLPFEYASELITSLLSSITGGKTSEPRVVKIPVCYGGEFGPDIENVAKLNGLTTEEVIHIHATGVYSVFMIGFAPGFPFIGGMSEKIAAPRRATPRLKIPARSVGIAGIQTGVYPIETPGGWQLIGRTPLELFRPDDAVPSLLQAGDQVQFTPISLEEYQEWENENQ
ncbi:5-oxoprolinase subunit PxpB [Cytobacillus purgationiresistens]|uniref:Inhibitor of KinA n=1 Tax=Cytobacillus purgationiresistens TaxID=863449 RepID=A0ABU0AKV7_9BACI|nr:5-oxoprolinase subunit PxpB [Cytobacillus purgationiresistens]MDQ0271888.1 inhibitor of KinA [Cytobacillus purgationiresistens]